MTQSNGDSNIPARSVDVANERLLSTRNTHYSLTDAEAEQLKNDTRSISSKKALSIYEGSDGKAVKITLDPEFKGHKDDWDRTGERNQRWEVANKGKQMGLKNSVYIKYTFKVSDFNPGRTGGSYFQVIANNNKSRLLPWMKIQYDGFEVFLTLALTREVFYLSGDLDNSNFDKISSKFILF